MDEHEPCEHCNDEGYIDDPLSSAMGGRWFRWCDCPVGKTAAEKDSRSHRETREKRMKDKIEAMARAGYTRNVELTWKSMASPPEWETTSEEVREVWREIMRAARFSGDL